MNYPYNTKLDTELVAEVASSMLAKNAWCWIQSGEFLTIVMTILRKIRVARE